MLSQQVTTADDLHHAMDGVHLRDDSDDDVPLSQRPAVVGNVQRPAHFIKPASPPPASVAGLPAALQGMQSMYERYSKKLYMEGYMLRYNERTVDGAATNDTQWTQWYVELCGPVLTLWEVAQQQQQQEQEDSVIPQFINLADASVTMMDPAQGILALNSAGANRILFQPIPYDPNDHPPIALAVAWAQAIRLACYEWFRIHEIYTSKFMAQHADQVAAATKTRAKMEGEIQVRFGGGEWQKQWVVVSDHRDEKTLFGKKKTPSRGQLMFFDNKKQKQPNCTVLNVVYAYTLYPESPQLLDMSTMIKIEGSTQLHADDSPASSSTGSTGSQSRNDMQVMLMASSQKELIQWLVAIFDSFKLYGRPARLLDDPANLNSLCFAEPVAIHNPRLFLDLHEVQQTDVYQDSFIDNKAVFSGILLHKMRQPAPQKPSSQPRAAQPPPSMMPASNEQSPQPVLKGRHGKPIYASDDDDTDNDAPDDASDSDSDDSRVMAPRTAHVISVAPASPPQLPAHEPINDENASSLHLSVPPAVPAHQDDNDDDDDDKDSLSDLSDASEPAQPAAPPAKKRPQPRSRQQRVAQPAVSGSDTEDEHHEPAARRPVFDSDEDDEEDDNVPLSQQQQQQQGFDPAYGDDAQQHPSMYDPVTGMYHQYDEYMMGGPLGLEMNEDGPVIPELGSNFATQNSLLDTYRPDHPSAKEQLEYARQTGDTLLHVPNKPPEPRTGLVGMISQREADKKERNANKGLLLKMEKDKLMEQERERYLWEQRQQQMPMQQMPMGQSMAPMAMAPPMQMPTMMNDPRMSMMPPMGMNQMQMPTLMNDPRMSMMNMNNMQNTQLGGGTSSAASMAPAMDPRMSMMPPMGAMGQMQMPPMMNDPRMSMMNMNNMQNMQMPMMMDPRMSMMNMQMMMNMYQTMLQQQQAMFGAQGMQGMPGMMPGMAPQHHDDDDDDDDDVPLGHQQQQQHKREASSNTSPPQL
ncbi:hypothetical protein BC940DRAFT_365927 [Gongronella butleri]|nr:hypothetical protein BC940DRAFT_365927 [Gongronella butleri]